MSGAIDIDADDAMAGAFAEGTEDVEDGEDLTPVDDTVPVPRSPQEMLAELQARGAVQVIAVAFSRAQRAKLTRTKTRDGEQVGMPAMFAAAPPEVLDALAAWSSSEPGPRLPKWARHLSPMATHLNVIRAYAATVDRAASASPSKTGGTPSRRCDGTPAQRAALRQAYDQLNAERFGGELPPHLPLRWSNRMSRTLGLCSITGAGETRAVREVVMSLVLAQPQNADQYRDTLAHELAHVQAWIKDGCGDHGYVWQRWARVAGCRPERCTPAGSVAKAPVGTRILDVPVLPPLRDGWATTPAPARTMPPHAVPPQSATASASRHR